MHSIQRILKTLLCVIILWPPATADAQVPGQDDPAMQAAIDLWLGGEDLRALEALSKLAQEGNLAAQMLLSGIDDRGFLHQHVTKDIPRKERIALMRIPKGLSGRSWLRAAADDLPLARAIDIAIRKEPLITGFDANEVAENARTLLKGGETGAALREILWGQNHRGPAYSLAVLQALGEDLPVEFVPYAAHNVRYVSHYTPAAGPLLKLWLAAVQSRHTPAQLDAAHLAWQVVHLRQDEDLVAAEAAYPALEAPVAGWHVLERFCGYECRGVKDACVISGAAILGLAPGIGMNSPRPSVVPDETYLKSRRAMGDLIRHAHGFDLPARLGHNRQSYHARACFTQEMADTAERLVQ